MASLSLLHEFVREALHEKRRRKKPGGPRTDVGAERQLFPQRFRDRVKAAFHSSKGDAQKAADTLGVAKRTAYHYLEDEPGLANVETTADKEEKP